jgi:transcriptional regulator with XRE-family HTH domain
MHTLPDAIRAAIHKSRLSVNDLARRSTVDKAVISRFLKGERTISVETAQKILSALVCAIEIVPVAVSEVPTPAGCSIMHAKQYPDGGEVLLRRKRARNLSRREESTDNTARGIEKPTD